MEGGVAWVRGSIVVSAISPSCPLCPPFPYLLSRKILTNDARVGSTRHGLLSAFSPNSWDILSFPFFLPSFLPSLPTLPQTGTVTSAWSTRASSRPSARSWRPPITASTWPLGKGEVRPCLPFLPPSRRFFWHPQHAYTSFAALPPTHPSSLPPSLPPDWVKDGWTIDCSGHSLGGALASLMAHSIGHRQPEVGRKGGREGRREGLTPLLRT